MALFKVVDDGNTSRLDTACTPRWLHCRTNSSSKDFRMVGFLKWPITRTWCTLALRNSGARWMDCMVVKAQAVQRLADKRLANRSVGLCMRFNKYDSGYL